MPSKKTSTKSTPNSQTLAPSTHHGNHHHQNKTSVHRGEPSASQRQSIRSFGTTPLFSIIMPNDQPSTQDHLFNRTQSVRQVHQILYFHVTRCSILGATIYLIAEVICIVPGFGDKASFDQYQCSFKPGSLKLICLQCDRLGQ